MTLATTEPFEDLFTAIDQMTVVELVGFVRAFEERFGVSATPPTVTQVVGDVPAEAEQVEEQTEFVVLLKSVGPAKIQVIKAIRELTQLGLKDAKDLVDAAPQNVKVDISKEEADRIAAALREQGAEVEVL